MQTIAVFILLMNLNSILENCSIDSKEVFGLNKEVVKVRYLTKASTIMTQVMVYKCLLSLVQGEKNDYNIHIVETKEKMTKNKAENWRTWYKNESEIPDVLIIVEKYESGHNRHRIMYKSYGMWTNLYNLTFEESLQTSKLEIRIHKEINAIASYPSEPTRIFFDGSKETRELFDDLKEITKFRDDRRTRWQ